MKLPTNAWVVVADGERHLLLKNAGVPVKPDLRIISVEERPVQRDSDVGTDRPGRNPGPGGRRETVEQTDWRRSGKEKFAAELAETLDAAVASGTCPGFVLIADPRTLGALRPRLGGPAKEALLAEISADLVHATVPEIEARIVGA